MLPVTRITDLTFGIGGLTHFPCIPYPVLGIHITGSSTIIVNNLPVTRVTDISIHTCPFCPINMNIQGTNVLSEGLPTTSVTNLEFEFCGIGISITGSPNTYFG